MKKQANPTNATLSQNSLPSATRSTNSRSSSLISSGSLSPNGSLSDEGTVKGADGSGPDAGVSPGAGNGSRKAGDNDSRNDSGRGQSDRPARMVPGGGIARGETGSENDDEAMFSVEGLGSGSTGSGLPNEHHAAIQQRRVARRIAVQALFEIDSVGHAPGVVVDERLASHSPGPHATQYLRWLVSGVVQNWDTLNDLIRQYAPEWPVEQLAIVDRNILRMAIYEIGSRESDAPAKAVINEAVELGKLFGSDSSPRFINGVLGSALDAVYRKLF